MRRSTMTFLTVSSLLVMSAPACSKKESSPPPAAAAAAPTTTVSEIPEPAERATDLSAVDSPIAGAVKEVKAKVLDKEADDKTKGLMRVKVLALDGPVDIGENTRIEVWKPGSDPEEQKPEMGDWGGREPEVPPGTWDLRLHYEEGTVKADGWVRSVTFTAGKLWKAEVLMAAPMQYVRIAGTLGGQDVADNMHIEVFKAGTDTEEFQPLASFWSTQKQPLAAGTYDLRLSYDKDNVKAKGSLKGLAIGGNHGVLKTTAVLNKQ